MIFIRTHSGLDVDLEAPTPEMISIRDIAHHLSLINRFNGATHAPYNVAQHSVLVADLLLARKSPARLCMAGLLHDAHEAYLGDITTPLKTLLGTHTPTGMMTLLECAAARFDDVILAKFSAGLSPDERHLIADADMKAFGTEWRDLMPSPCPQNIQCSPHPVRPMTWHRAEEMFLKIFNTLARHLGLPEA